MMLRSLAPARSPRSPLSCPSSTAAAVLQNSRWALTKHWQFSIVRGIVLLAAFITGASAQRGTPVTLFGNSSCKVIEEDAIPFRFGSSYFFRQDLYMQIVFPDSKWRVGLRNDGLKGLSLVDVSLQAGQLTSPQYTI